ncbi:MAG: hypothetical protein KI785_09225 [Devosiaceae bacterium]|nr:hypothetical protein [Devosiaceae bacterium MH13]
MSMVRGALVAGLTGLFVFASPVSDGASQGRLLESYTARLSAADHRTSEGVRHDTAAGVLRQDRANVHRFDAADEEDEVDSFFTDAQTRARFERLVARGLIRPDVRRAIINGTPLVRVTVYPTRVGVELLED